MTCQTNVYRTNCLCLQSSPRNCLVIIFERQCFFHRAPKSAYRRDPLDDLRVVSPRTNADSLLELLNLGG